MRTAARAITRTDLAVDAGGLECLLGAPVDGVDRGSNRKRKRGGLVVSQMRSEALHNQRVAVVEYGEHLVRCVTADHSDGTRRDRPGVAPVVDGERLLQGCLDTAHAGQADDP